MKIQPSKVDLDKDIMMFRRSIECAAQILAQSKGWESVGLSFSVKFSIEDCYDTIIKFSLAEVDGRQGSLFPEREL